MRGVALCNVFMLLCVVGFTLWLGVLYNTDPTVPLNVKIQSDVLRMLLFLSGATPDSPFPFSRWILSLHPRTSTDEVTTFSLSVPSLQPNGSRSIVPIRLYVPSIPKKTYHKVPVLVWMHGGGFLFGTISDYINDHFARRLADYLGFYVIAVDYSLSPEHKFPDALEDVYSVLYHLNLFKSDWILGKGHFENLIPMSTSTTFLGGIGSGGTLAIHSKLLWEDRRGSQGTKRLKNYSFIPHHHFHESGRLNILGQIAITPDLMESGPHYQTSNYTLTSTINDYWRELHFKDLGNEEAMNEQRTNLYFNVLANREERLTDLRVFLYSMTGSLFHQQCKDFQGILTQKGVLASHVALFDQPHGGVLSSSETTNHFLFNTNNFVQSEISSYYSK